MSSPLCTAVDRAGNMSVTVYSDGSRVLTAPQVVVYESALPGRNLPRSTTGSDFPGFAVVPRADAIANNVPIVHDPWFGVSAGTQVAGHMPPAECYAALVTGPTPLVDQTWFRVALAGGALALGLGLFWWLRRR